MQIRALINGEDRGEVSALRCEPISAGLVDGVARFEARVEIYMDLADGTTIEIPQEVCEQAQMVDGVAVLTYNGPVPVPSKAVDV